MLKSVLIAYLEVFLRVNEWCYSDWSVFTEGLVAKRTDVFFKKYPFQPWVCVAMYLHSLHFIRKFLTPYQFFFCICPSVINKQPLICFIKASSEPFGDDIQATCSLGAPSSTGLGNDYISSRRLLEESNAGLSMKGIQSIMSTSTLSRNILLALQITFLPWLLIVIKWRMFVLSWFYKNRPERQP